MGVPATATLPNVSDPNVGSATGSGDLGYPVTGNRIVVRIGDVIIAMAQMITASDDYGVEPVMSLGYMAPRAIVPTSARYTLSLSVVLMNHSSLQRINDGGGALAPNKPEWAMGTYSAATDLTPGGGENFAVAGWEQDIAIINRDTGDVLVKYGGAVYASGTLNATANRIIITDAVYVARSRDGLLGPLYATTPIAATATGSTGGEERHGNSNAPAGSSGGTASGGTGVGLPPGGSSQGV